jgi:hypothetical protein
MEPIVIGAVAGGMLDKQNPIRGMMLGAAGGGLLGPGAAASSAGAGAGATAATTNPAILNATSSYAGKNLGSAAVPKMAFMKPQNMMMANMLLGGAGGSQNQVTQVQPNKPSTFQPTNAIGNLYANQYSNPNKRKRRFSLIG